MILDGYWKRELRKNAITLRFWCAFSVFSSSFIEHQVNKSILYSAVIIRKMFEDEKGAESEIRKSEIPMPPLKLLKYKVKVTVYPFSGDENFIIERVIPENYDCKNAVEKEIELNTLCNQIIHSFVWSIAYEPKPHKIFGVFFASDKAKEDVLCVLEPDELIKAIKFCVEKGNI